MNYGDGHGTKRLTLTRAKRFLLRHRYARRGTYTITVRVRNGRGLLGTSRLKVVVAKR